MSDFSFDGAEALAGRHQAPKTTRGNKHDLYDSLARCERRSPEVFDNMGSSRSSQIL